MKHFSRLKSRVNDLKRALLSFTEVKAKLANIPSQYEETEVFAEDKQAIIDDYIMLCGYTEDEANAAYRNMLDY